MIKIIGIKLSVLTALLLLPFKVISGEISLGNTVKKTGYLVQKKVKIKENILHKGIYVNNFKNDILGNAVAENELLAWCAQHTLNEITLYNIGSILTSTTKTHQLKQFMKKARLHDNYNITFVAATLTGLTRIETYQKANKNTYAACNGIFTEYEFWNNNGGTNQGFAYYKNNELDVMEAYRIKGLDNLKQNLYISKFEDTQRVYKNEEVLQETVKYLTNNKDSKLIFVDYKTNAQNFPTSKTSNFYQRYQALANEAAANNKAVNVVVLFMVRQDVTPTLFNYFSVNDMNNSFESAYTNFKNGFLNSDITNKAYINLIGYQLYRYSDAKIARPLTGNAILGD